MLGQFSGEKEPNSSLNLPRGDGRALVVMRQAGSLSSDPLKDVVHKAVHDGHGLSGDASVRVNLLQDLVDVDSVALLPLLLFLLVALGDVLLRLPRLLRSFTGSFRCHVDQILYDGNGTITLLIQNILSQNIIFNVKLPTCV